MAHLDAALDKFLICDPERSRTTGNIFVAHVDDTDRERLGRLFVVTEMSPANERNHEVIRLLQDTLNASYYAVTDRGVETAFEQALAETNARLQDTLRGEHHNWLPGFSTFVGVLRDSLLVFTHVGAVQAFLVRGNRIVDLIHTGGKEPPTNPLKIFTSVVSGQLEEGDYLLATTPSLLDYFSQEKLRRTIQGVPPTESAAYLDSILRDNPANTTFAGLILRLAPQLTPRRQPLESPAASPLPTTTSEPHVSMQRLIERERVTKELLTPSMWHSLKLLLQSASVRIEDSIRTRFLRKPPRRRIISRHEPSAQPRSLLLTGALGLWRLLLRLLRLILMLLIAGVGSLARLLRRPAQRPTTAPPGQRLVRSFFAWRFFPRQQRLVIVGIAALAAMLTVGIVVGARRGGTPTKIERASIERSINEKTEQAEARLTYGDKRGAKQLIAEIETLLAKLPAKSKRDKQTVAALRDKLSGPKETLRHEIHPTFANAGALTGIGSGAPVSLAKLGATLYVATKEGDIIGLTPPEQPELLASPSSAFGADELLVDGNSFLLRHGTTLLRFSPATRKFSPETVELSPDTTAMTIFRDRLYAVDAKTGQILRYPRAASGYGTGKPWLTDKTVSLDNVVSLAIDGSVFLLRSDGTMTELIQGVRQDFSLEPVDPPLTAAATLWTTADVQYLYLWSPSSERFLVFEKTGRLKQQYADAKFKDALGFAIDERGGAGYLLTSTSVEKFELQFKK